MADERIELDRIGGGFLLRRIDGSGVVSEMSLTDESILKIAANAQRLRDQILAERSRPGADATLLTPVSMTSLNHDLHMTCLHLGLIDSGGHEALFSLPLEVARPLAKALPRWIAKLEAAPHSQTKQ